MFCLKTCKVQLNLCKISGCRHLVAKQLVAFFSIFSPDSLTVPIINKIHCCNAYTLIKYVRQSGFVCYCSVTEGHLCIDILSLQSVLPPRGRFRVRLYALKKQSETAVVAFVQKNISLYSD